MDVFVVPALDGPPTGGTLYNRRLCEALRELEVPHRVASALDVLSGPDAFAGARLWVDSLFFDRLEPLADAARGRAELNLLVHYLPSLVRVGVIADRGALTPGERVALERCRRFAVPSAFMADVLGRLGIPENRIARVEPGYEAPHGLAVGTSAPAAVQALMIANLVEGKGVLPFVEGLKPAHRGDDRLGVKIVGGGDAQPQYAQACQRAVTDARAAGVDVELVGAQSSARCFELLVGSDMFVSSSRMESFGMAIAEARACGLPIVACAGGNVASLIEEAAGGQLVAGATEVAAACTELARDRAGLDLRRHAARSAARTRSWLRAAQDFVSGSQPNPR